MTQPAHSRLLRPDDVAYMLGVSKTTLKRLVASGVLPKPTYISPRCPRWPLAAVNKVVDASTDRGDYDDPDEALEQWAYERRKNRAAQAG